MVISTEIGHTSGDGGTCRKMRLTAIHFLTHCSELGWNEVKSGIEIAAAPPSLGFASLHRGCGQRKSRAVRRENENSCMLGGAR